MPCAGVLSLSLRSRADAEAVRLAVLPAAAVCAAVVEIEPAAGCHRHHRRADGSRAGGLVGERRSAFNQQLNGALHIPPSSTFVSSPATAEEILSIFLFVNADLTIHVKLIFL